MSKQDLMNLENEGEELIKEIEALTDKTMNQVDKDLHTLFYGCIFEGELPRLQTVVDEFKKIIEDTKKEMLRPKITLNDFNVIVEAMASQRMTIFNKMEVLQKKPESKWTVDEKEEFESLKSQVEKNQILDNKLYDMAKAGEFPKK